MIVLAVLLDFSAAFDIIDHELLLKNSLVMALHHLPSRGWKVIYPIGRRECFSMEVSLTSHMYSAVSLRAVPWAITLLYFLIIFFTKDLHKARMTHSTSQHPKPVNSLKFKIRRYSQYQNG